MPTYVYETIEPPHSKFEVRQSMKDAPLNLHPDTGVPIRRVISGGYGILQKGGPTPLPAKPRSTGCCGGGCGCRH